MLVTLKTASGSTGEPSSTSRAVMREAMTRRYCGAREMGLRERSSRRNRGQEESASPIDMSESLLPQRLRTWVVEGGGSGGDGGGQRRGVGEGEWWKKSRSGYKRAVEMVGSERE